VDLLKKAKVLKDEGTDEEFKKRLRWGKKHSGGQNMTDYIDGMD